MIRLAGRPNLGRPMLVVRLVATGVALSRIIRAANRRPPLTLQPSPGLDPTISVIIPARDEAGRIGPLLDALRGAPGVTNVIVVDDQSTDDTAGIASRAGAAVVAGAPLATGWAGKAWALQQGIEASSGEWIVTLDADTRPDPTLPLAVVRRARADGLRFVSVGGRFDCPTSAAAWLHPAMLTTLVYRFGPSGQAGRVAADRQLANGQCMAFARAELLDEATMAAVAGEIVEDVALARHLAARGWTVAMLDGPSLLTTLMYDDGPTTFRGWARSLALPGVEPLHRQLLDLGVVIITQVMPLPRLALRRGDAVDAVLAMVRLGTLVGTRSAYLRRGWPYWLSPAADLAAAVAMGRGILNPRQGWRGRSYD